MKVKIFTTGGSIDKGYSTKDSGFVVRGPEVGNILEDANVNFDYEVAPLLAKDSLELTEADRTLIEARIREDSSERILITHGTDTMAETGRRLASVEGKTIVLTGAFQPASFKHTDAHFNVGFAMAAVQILPPGVYLAMSGRVLHPDRARKRGEGDRFEDSLLGG